QNSILPAQVKLLPHQAGRDVDAQRHRHQQQPADKSRHRRWTIESVPRIQAKAQGVKRPRHLPGTKILLPALLIEVGEQQEQQQGNYPGNDHQTDGEATHTARNRSPSRDSLAIGWLGWMLCFHTHLAKTIVKDGIYARQVGLLVTSYWLPKFV